ncbi:MAG: drug/metabolite exporter YedA [Pseudoxanthomonas sp.]
MNSPVAAPVRGGSVAFALALLYVIWGSTYLGIRFALEGGFPPFLLGGIRFVVAGTLLFGFLRLRGVPVPTRAQWANAAALGLMLLLMGNGLVNFAEQTVSSGIAAVVVASVPLWMGIFAAMRGQHPSRLEWLGMMVGFAGVAWLNAGGMRSGSLAGLLALLAASIAWSFGSVWSRGRDLAPPFMNTAAQMLCGGVAMLGVGLATGERFAAMPSAGAWAAFWYLVVFGSLIGFSAYVWLLHHARPALVGSYAYVNPVIAVLLGVWLAHERFGAHDLGAMLLIVAGVVVITLAKLGRRA